MINFRGTSLHLRNSICGLISIFLGLTAEAAFTKSAQALTDIDYSVTPVSFGTYNSSSGSNLTSSGGIRINRFYEPLTNALVSTSFTVKLSPGSGTYGSRKMTNLANPLSTLQYNLYTSSGSSAPIWGDGSAGSSFISQTGSSNIDIPIYGIVPNGQNPSVGTYSDSINVTIEFN